MKLDLFKSRPLGVFILITSLLTSIAFFMVMKDNARMETDLDKYMPHDHPAFVFSDKAEGWFGIKDGIIIAIEREDGIYKPDTLAKVKKLTKVLQKMPEIKKADVTSLYTADNIIGSDGGMDVRPFFKRAPKTVEAAEKIRTLVRANEMIAGRLVSEDENVTVIVVEIEDDVFSQAFYQRLIKLSKEYEGPERLHVAGTPIVEGTMALLGPADMKRMVPIVLLVIVVVLLFLLRSFKATFFTMLVVTFSVLWAFGLMAAVGIPIYAVSTMIPVMLIAIGVADGIHLYSHLHIFMEHNPEATKQEAVVDMVKHMWRPVAMTSVTTAVGFISLLSSEVYPVKYFGLFTAFGVMMAMVFSLFLIPASLVVFGLPRWKKKDPNAADSDRPTLGLRFSTLMRKYRFATLGLTVVIVAVSILGIGKVWINSSFLDKFENTSDIVQTDAFINAHFGGTSSLNVILNADKPGAFKDPAVLTVINTLQADVDGRLEVVGNSFALTDYIRRMNKVMHADDPTFDTIPETRELVAQYLLLYEMSGDPENLWAVVDYDYQRANLTFQLKSDNSKGINATLDAIKTHEPALEALGVHIQYAGSGYKGLIFTDLILEGQIKSLVASLLIVVVLLGLMFRSLLIGLIGAVPIIITAILSFGLMGWLNIPLSTTTALLSSIAIGIGIDYAVHFIERYKVSAETLEGAELVGAMTMHHSGRAIIFNALVVIAGFLVLLASVFPPNRALGALVSLNMFTSFVGTVTVMYILLAMSGLYMKKGTQK
jgi:hypothetical protein